MEKIKLSEYARKTEKFKESSGANMFELEQSPTNDKKIVR